MIFFIDIPSNINSLSVFVEYLDYSVSKDYRVFSNDLQISFLGLKTQCKYNPGQIVYVNDFRDYKELCDEYNLSYLSLSNEYFNEYGLLLLWQGTPSYPPSSASFKSCVLYRNTLYAEVKTSSSIDGDFTNDYAFVYVFAICVPLDVAENYEKIFYKEFAKKD